MITKGLYLMSVRKDGEEIAGVVESVRSLPKGTLVVVSVLDGPDKVYASVYLENTRWYRACTMTTPPIMVVSHDSDLPSMVG